MVECSQTGGTDGRDQQDALAVLRVQMAALAAEMATLRGENKALHDENKTLKRRITQLETKLAKARKNSSTSSKPPSSDIVKSPRSPKNKGGGKRKKGGQPGHPKHDRPPFRPEQITDFHSHTLDACPDCGGTLALTDNVPKVIQQIEIIETPIRIDEHRG